MYTRYGAIITSWRGIDSTESPLKNFWQVTQLLAGRSGHHPCQVRLCANILSQCISTRSDDYQLLRQGRPLPLLPPHLKQRRVSMTTTRRLCLAAMILLSSEPEVCGKGSHCQLLLLHLKKLIEEQSLTRRNATTRVSILVLLCHSS